MRFRTRLQPRSTTRKLVLLAWLVLPVSTGLAAVGCGDEQKAVNRVGAGVIEKSVFTGSWYMSRTVVDVDYEAAGLGTFPGDAASDAATTFTAIPRIRWVIEQHTLYAYRDYSLVEGGDGESKASSKSKTKAEDFGQPVAAYRIEKHFDVERGYNPSTGEQRNVIVENDQDEPWQKRSFMRVDWSKNLLPGYFGQTQDLYELLGQYTREPASLYVQDASRFPQSYAPRFDRMACESRDDEECSAIERDLAADYEPNELYHMSFVSQEILSPGSVPDPETGEPVSWCAAKLYSDAPPCSSIVSYVRTSFLKVSDTRQYEPLNYVDSRFDRFGYFRLESPTIDRSTGAPSDPAFGATDFLNYNVNRHNLWMKWRDEAGKAIPYRDREVRKIVWYTTPELPAHLVEPSFDVISQWNEIFMQTVRKLRGQPLPTYPDVKCQEVDPDAYCYCEKDPKTRELLNATCKGQYDFQKAPDAYAAGTQDAFDCYVKVPSAARKVDWNDRALEDADFNAWFGAKFVGDECVSVLRINTCNRASLAADGGDELECEQRGDMRYKFLSYVDQPGTGFLGIATLRGDPVTGEIMAGDANIGGPALDSYRTSALDTYDLINGDTTELDVQVGEDVRGYFESLNQVQLPARPRADLPQGGQSVSVRDEIDSRMQSIGARLQKLHGADGRQAILSDRKQTLVGSDLERRLIAGLDTQTLQNTDPGSLSDSQLMQSSPLRTGVHERMKAMREKADRYSRANVTLPTEYSDDSVQRFAMRHADWPRARLEYTLNRLLYRETQLHELGHCLGLRHDFGASADSDHYKPEYYAITERHPLPDPEAFDVDGKLGLSADESLAYEKEYKDVRSQRELLGIDGAMSSSIMEYTANWYERLQSLGAYDKAAIDFGYGDLVEAYDGPVSFDTPRKTLRYYQGGETCTQDSDCPYARGGKHQSELLDENMDNSLTQRCVANPRTPFTKGTKICSSIDADIARSATNGGKLAPLKYRFCTDERADSTLGFCNRFDEGETYREIVRNVEESYERMYLFQAFRRYRADFSASSYADQLLSRRLGILQNVYENLVFSYLNDPSFRKQEGAFGFYDQFLATTDILNFYARILAQPNVGGYSFSDQTGTYARVSEDPASQAADLSLPLGLGRYFYSDYQSGLSGIERLERVGSIFDKVQVIGLLTERGGTLDYTRDVAFYSNFYDLFPSEMQEIFSGMIRNDPRSYMPRVVCGKAGGARECNDPRLLYMNFYRGDCSKTATCLPNPAEVTYAKLPVLDGGGSITLQIYAAIYGLSDFPVYFDTTFQNQLFVCIEGQADCYAPAPDAVQGVDYVRYTSPRYRRTFVAWQVEPREESAQQASIGFAMVKEARDLDVILAALTRLQADEDLTPAELDALEAIGYEVPTTATAVDRELSRVTQRIANLESFFNQIIEIQRSYGIKGIAYFTN